MRIGSVLSDADDSAFAHPLQVREITKSSSTFSATNVSSKMIRLLQLHDTIQMKSNYT